MTICTPLALNMAVASSEVIVPALGSAVLLHKDLAAQTERASMPRFVQVSNELMIFGIYSNLPAAIDDHSLSTLLNDTKKKTVKSKEELKVWRTKRKLCRTKSGCWPPRIGLFKQKEIFSSQCWMKKYLQFSKIVETKMDVFSAMDARHVEVTFAALSDLPKSSARETMEFEPFATKLTRKRSCQWVFAGLATAMLSIIQVLKWLHGSQ